jgi:hypothetical protein
MSRYSEGSTERTLGVLPTPEGNYDAVTLADSGAVAVTTDTTLETPTSGKRLRLRWIYIASPSDSEETVVTVRFGTTEHFKIPLTAPGVFMKTTPRYGAVDETLNVVLSVDTTVYVNYEFEEVTD